MTFFDVNKFRSALWMQDGADDGWDDESDSDNEKDQEKDLLSILARAQKDLDVKAFQKFNLSLISSLKSNVLLQNKFKPLLYGNLANSGDEQVIEFWKKTLPSLNMEFSEVEYKSTTSDRAAALAAEVAAAKASAPSAEKPVGQKSVQELFAERVGVQSAAKAPSPPPPLASGVQPPPPPAEVPTVVRIIPEPILENINSGQSSYDESHRNEGDRSVVFKVNNIDYSLPLKVGQFVKEISSDGPDKGKLAVYTINEDNRPARWHLVTQRWEKEPTLDDIISDPVQNGRHAPAEVVFNVGSIRTLTLKPNERIEKKDNKLCVAGNGADKLVSDVWRREPLLADITSGQSSYNEKGKDKHAREVEFEVDVVQYKLSLPKGRFIQAVSSDGPDKRKLAIYSVNDNGQNVREGLVSKKWEEVGKDNSISRG